MTTGWQTSLVTERKFWQNPGNFVAFLQLGEGNQVGFVRTAIEELRRWPIDDPTASTYKEQLATFLEQFLTVVEKAADGDIPLTQEEVRCLKKASAKLTMAASIFYVWSEPYIRKGTGHIGLSGVFGDQARSFDWASERSRGEGEERIRPDATLWHNLHDFLREVVKTYDTLVMEKESHIYLPGST